MQLIMPKTKCEVDAIKEVIDLLHNGYTDMFSCGYFNGIIYKLRHRKNGRILTVKIMPQYYEIKEKGEVIKRVPYPE